MNLPQSAKEIFDGLGSDKSYASYAIRYAAGFDGICMVLSGMSDMKQMNDNLSFMTDFEPLSEEESEAVNKVSAILKNSDIIQCTACRYCTAGCPKNINIPELFACLNAKKQDKGLVKWNSRQYYNAHVKNGGRAKDCIGCGKCEEICPQQLPIRSLLKDVSKEFDRKI